MQVQAGSLYWPRTVRLPRPGDALDHPISCDVLVVGAGVTGALTALHLAQTGARVVVADRAAAATGSTPASTALLEYEIDISLLELRGKIGKDTADEAYLRSLASVMDMRSLVEREGIDCDLLMRRSLYLAATDSDVQELMDEAEARQGLGIGATFLSHGGLMEGFGIARPAAILNDVACELNPMKLTRGLLEKARALGVRIFEHAEVDFESITRHGARQRIRTKAGHPIETDWILVATGYEAPKRFGAVCDLTTLKSTFALATSVFEHEPWPERMLVWEAAEPYLYMRTTADNRVLVGGEDERFQGMESAAKMLDRKCDALMHKLKELMPRSQGLRAEQVWTGAFAETDDGLPIIGEHPDWPNVLFALGYGGNGITFSLLAAQLLRDMVEKSQSVPDMFSFARTTSR